MKDDQRDRGNPVHALVLGHVDDVSAQLISRKTWLRFARAQVNEQAATGLCDPSHLTLPAISPGVCKICVI